MRQKKSGRTEEDTRCTQPELGKRPAKADTKSSVVGQLNLAAEFAQQGFHPPQAALEVEPKLGKLCYLGVRVG